MPETANWGRLVLIPMHDRGSQKAQKFKRDPPRKLAIVVIDGAGWNPLVHDVDRARGGVGSRHTVKKRGLSLEKTTALLQQ